MQNVGLIFLNSLFLSSVLFFVSSFNRNSTRTTNAYMCYMCEHGPTNFSLHTTTTAMPTSDAHCFQCSEVKLKWDDAARVNVHIYLQLLLETTERATIQELILLVSEFPELYTSSPAENTQIDEEEHCCSSSSCTLY